MTNIVKFPMMGLEFIASKVAFSIFGKPIYWYGIIIALSLGIAMIYAFKQAKKAGIKKEYLTDMLMFGIPISITCARLYYVAFNWEYFSENLIKIPQFWTGGIAIYGALIGAVGTVIVYCRSEKIKSGKVLDILAVGFIIGQIIGRWGNFINGEAFGYETSLPWAMSVIQGEDIIANMVHPTFIYESLWNLAGLGLYFVLRNRKMFDGEVFWAYISWYGLGRLWIEGLRADSLMWGALRSSQVLALISLILGVIVIAAGRSIMKARYKNSKGEDEHDGESAQGRVKSIA